MCLSGFLIMAELALTSLLQEVLTPMPPHLSNALFGTVPDPAAGSATKDGCDPLLSDTEKKKKKNGPFCSPVGHLSHNGPDPAYTATDIAGPHGQYMQMVCQLLAAKTAGPESPVLDDLLLATELCPARLLRKQLLTVIVARLCCWELNRFQPDCCRHAHHSPPQYHSRIIFHKERNVLYATGTDIAGSNTSTSNTSH